MEIPIRQQELLELYFDGKLTGEDLAEFKQLAQTDPNFRQEAELQQRISQAIKQAGRADLKTFFNRIHAEMLNEQQNEQNE